MKKILITGGAGFIGSHVINHFVTEYPNYQIVNLDNLTYASDLSNVKVSGHPNYKFVQGDIRDRCFLKSLFSDEKFTDVIHLAAESHVDNSIHNPLLFAETNIIGTLNLLEMSSKNFGVGNRFYHVSTDEVYGHLGETGYFTEETPYNPRSPYSASKASSDMFVRAYGTTFNLNYVISNCSNNYGEHQNEEKFIPKVIKNLIKNEKIPVYGKGQNIRDWLYVQDHVDAIDLIFHFGETSETYNVGAFQTMSNINLIETICDLFNKLQKTNIDFTKAIEFIEDRKGHDFRYAIDSSKLMKLGWKPSMGIEYGLIKTINWYITKHETFKSE